MFLSLQLSPHVWLSGQELRDTLLSTFIHCNCHLHPCCQPASLNRSHTCPSDAMILHHSFHRLRPIRQALR